MTHDQPLRRIWGQDQSTGAGPVRATVRRLRRKLSEDASPLTYFFTKGRGGFRVAKWATEGRQEP